MLAFVCNNKGADYIFWCKGGFYKQKGGLKLRINEFTSLSELLPGEKGKVVRLDLNGVTKRRIQDLGLIDNTVVEALQKSPSGDPVAYFIRGAVIALRSEIASAVMIEKIG